MKLFRIFSLVSGVILASPSSAEIKRISENPSLEEIANKVSFEVTINAPLDNVWHLVAEQFDQSKTFNAEAAKTFYTQGEKPGVGSRRRTINQNGKFIDVEITRFDPVTRNVAWEIISTDVAPLVVGYASYQLSAVSASETRLTQNAGFKLKYGLMDAVGRRKFPKIFQTELAAIKHYLETGEAITQNTKKAIRKRYSQDVRRIN